MLGAGTAAAQVDCTATATTGVPQIQCEALMALYDGTDGPNWDDNTGWDTASAVNTWNGVTVTGGQVGNLDLSGNQLTGTIPTELGNLTALLRLFLNSNSLSGSIPTELGNLTNLTVLYLYNNQLTGTIPTELGNLTNLESLHLGGNSLSGSIPTELGNLTNLRYFLLYDNQLTGTIPLSSVTSPTLRTSSFTTTN